MLAWHFLKEDRRLRYQDKAHVELNKWYRYHGGGLKICKRGMHASKRLRDALYYAPGSVICRVEVRGEIIEYSDQLVAEERRVLWWLDGTELLWRFARACAWDVVGLWYAPEVVRQYLLTGDEELRDAAHSASQSASQSAARDAARSATRSAVWNAAWNVAQSAVWNAAWNVAQSAARSAARSATRSATWNATRSAVWNAGQSATRSVSWNKYNRWLTAMVLDEHRKEIRC